MLAQVFPAKHLCSAKHQSIDGIEEIGNRAEKASNRHSVGAQEVRCKGIINDRIQAPDNDQQNLDGKQFHIQSWDDL